MFTHLYQLLLSFVSRTTVTIVRIESLFIAFHLFLQISELCKFIVYSDLRQLNKNLFGSDDDSDEDEPAAPAKKSEPEPIATRPLQNADDFFKLVEFITRLLPFFFSCGKHFGRLRCRKISTICDKIHLKRRDSDDEGKTDKTAKATAADLFGSDIDDDSDVEKPPDTGTAAATQVSIFLVFLLFNIKFKSFCRIQNF